MYKTTNTLTILFAAVLAMLAFTGCESGVGDDARQTPIGSVISGETKDSGEYFRKIREENSGRSTDSWRPESPDRF